jgi:hypothetical protein
MSTPADVAQGGGTKRTKWAELHAAAQTAERDGLSAEVEPRSRRLGLNDDGGIVSRGVAAWQVNPRLLTHYSGEGIRPHHVVDELAYVYDGCLCEVLAYMRRTTGLRSDIYLAVLPAVCRFVGAANGSEALVALGIDEASLDAVDGDFRDHDERVAWAVAGAWLRTQWEEWLCHV